MGREVRRVPLDWEHPKNSNMNYEPLSEGYEEQASEWLDKANIDGLQAAIDWFGSAPDRNEYMPDWPESERVGWQMYEDTSEGTPISPVLKSPEELARWLAENGASAFGSEIASYDAWLATIRAGSAPSAVFSPGKGMMSGVAASVE